MPYTRQDLINDIKNLGVDKNGTLFVHSSIRSVGDVEGGGETILDAFIEYMKDGLYVMPTHTWATIMGDGSLFDPQTEKSCVGKLPDLFMRRPGVLRSLHPTHSVAALGADAASFVEGEINSLTPCARRGCYGKLLDRKAQILFLGCSLKCNTFLHGVEEWADVPHRITEKPVDYRIKMPNGEIYHQAGYRHDGSVYPNVSADYDKMEKPFLSLGIAREGRIGDARSVLCDAAGMAEFVTGCLKRNIQLLADDSPVPEEYY